MTTKIIFAYATYTLMMMVYSLINVPYASLLGVMSANPQVRTEFSSYRMTFAFGGSILVLFLIEPLVDIFSKMKITENIPDIAFGWQMVAVVFAIMASGMFLLTFLWTKERVQPIKEEKGSLKEDLKDLGRNKPWWILLCAGIMALVFNSLRDGSAVFYFKYYVDRLRYILFLTHEQCHYSNYYLLGIRPSSQYSRNHVCAILDQENR